MNVLQLFDTCTAEWFSSCIGKPTAVQESSWPLIAEGKDTLVSAPTGTGKTLSAFLVFIDRMMREARSGMLSNELQLIYISPLKSLAGDIRENLNRPLEGIFQAMRCTGTVSDEAKLSVAIRTGDTTQSERRQMVKKPPHILITTPESLYLLLTSKSGQAMLTTARWLIIDELHALIDTKRGAHMMLSVARLDMLCKRPLQRIGLSATIEPLNKAAEYLSPGPAVIAAPEMHKEISLFIESPQQKDGEVKKDAAWQEIARLVYDHCLTARSVIAFVEGRAYAEKLAFYVNEMAGEGFARTHHGSISKEQRLEVEHALRGGRLRLLCATSSMELGIDVGEIDMVFQVGCPRSISSTMQRLGRAGHNPNRVSTMIIFPRAPVEGLYSGLAAEVVKKGGVEHSHPPRLCLDVLAQHLTSMAAVDGYDLSDVMAILKRAYPFREVTLQDVREVLQMLAGDYEHERDIPVRPRVLYDRIHDRVDPDPYSRMLAVSAGGTIPDKGLYSAKTENGVKLGELDEEFVFEARVGDKFLLGAFAWQILSIHKDTVTVAPTTAQGARPPFWKGEIRGRRLKTGQAYGEIFRRLTKANEAGSLLAELYGLGLNEPSAQSAGEFVKRQLSVTGVLPDDRTLIVEHYRDEAGNHQMMVHSVFGRPVNEPLAILATEEAKRQLGINISFVADDDGFLLFPYEDRALPRNLLHAIRHESAGAVLRAILPVTPLYNMAFRYNAARALMMGMKNAGRQPLWVQRIRSADMQNSLVRSDRHPLVRETKRECLEDYWDIAGVELILDSIRSGSIRVLELYQELPSPMSLTLRRQTEASMMYDYAPTPSGVHAAVEEALKQTRPIDPTPQQLEKQSERTRLPENESQLHSLLMIEGDLMPGELNVPSEWLDTLEECGRAKYIEPGLWIAAEHEGEYVSALTGSDTEKMAHITRRLLRYRGPQAMEQIAQRYSIPESAAELVLKDLLASGDAVHYQELFYHGQLFDRAVRETVSMRRRQVRTLPPERYAALLAGRLHVNAPPAEQLKSALNMLSGMPFPAALWESLLLPLRVNGYRAEMLDTLLAKGQIVWRLTPEGELGFHPYEDIDWDADIAQMGADLQDAEKALFDTLLKRGASFTHSLASCLQDGSVQETLNRLADKGLARADSFVPIRQRLEGEMAEKVSARRRINARVMAATSGRWELARPLIEIPLNQRLHRSFDRFIILCRETAQGLNWEEAVKLLRLWEYTGQVRRGYFINGLSGMQFIREKDFAGVMHSLEQPEDEIVWLPAADVMQPYGKYLAHLPDRSFMNLNGTAVALKQGVPTAVFERQGKTLKVFDFEHLEQALRLFVLDYASRRIYPALSRLTLREYPSDAAEMLHNAGFKKEMQDFVLYRGYR